MPFSPTPVLAPLSALYGAVTRARLTLYRSGMLKTHRLDAPVISVGNLTAGGTGKTPLVEWLARRLAGDGRRVCILTRGYGRADASRRVVVSDGARVLADAHAGGDEPRMLAEELCDVGVAVVSDADRLAAARWALENLGSDLFILDDGFQHLRIARDLDTVTLDATNPWGGHRLLPRGRLREPPYGLARADVVVITRADLATDLEALRAEAKHLSGGRAALVNSRMRTRRVRPLQTTSTSVESASQKTSAVAEESVPQRVAAFCALGNADAFFAHLRRDGYELSARRAFTDHHVYTQADVRALVRLAEESGARALLTTAKDGVKLRHLDFSMACYVVEVGLEFDDEAALFGVVRRAVARKAVSG